MYYKLFTKRYLALFIDMLFIFIIIITLEFTLFKGPNYNKLKEDEKSEYISNKSNRFLLYNLLIIFKDLKFLSFGKKMFGLKVILDNQLSEEPKYYHLLLRNITLIYILSFFEIFVIFANNKNKRIGDLIAKTLVIQKE